MAGLLSRSSRIFRIAQGSRVSVGQKSTLRAHQMAHPGQLSHKSSCGAQSRLRSFSPVSLFRKEAQVQHICWIVDITVCYNTKTAIQTVWNSGGTSDSVVIEWWTSLCDAKTGAYGDSQHRASSGPFRLHRWSHCVRA